MYVGVKSNIYTKDLMASENKRAHTNSMWSSTIFTDGNHNLQAPIRPVGGCQCSQRSRHILEESRQSCRQLGLPNDPSSGQCGLTSGHLIIRQQAGFFGCQIRPWCGDVDYIPASDNKSKLGVPSLLDMLIIEFDKRSMHLSLNKEDQILINLHMMKCILFEVGRHWWLNPNSIGQVGC